MILPGCSQSAPRRLAEPVQTQLVAHKKHERSLIGRHLHAIVKAGSEVVVHHEGCRVIIDLKTIKALDEAGSTAARIKILERCFRHAGLTNPRDTAARFLNTLGEIDIPAKAKQVALGLDGSVRIGAAW